MIDQIIIILYLLVMLGIGLFFARKQKSEEVFFLAGKDLGTFHVVSTIFSTVAGAGSLFMVASLGYTYGISVIWFFISAFVGFIIFSFAVPKIKRIADENDCVTLPELLRARLDKRSMIVSSIATIAIFSGLVAVNFLAAGNILKILFDIPLVPIVIGFAIIVTIYSLLGGFKAVVWTDIVQMFIIIIGVLIALYLLLNSVGGLSSFSQLPATHKDPVGMGWSLIIGLFVSTILCYFSSQDIMQRIFAAKNEKVAKTSAIWMGVVLIVVGSLVALLGIYGKLLFPDAIAGEIIPLITRTVVPLGFSGIVLAAYLSMANSTADSELLTVTSNVMRDFYGPSKFLTPKQEVRASRLVLVIVALIALVLALTIKNITDIVLAMYTWFGILGMNVIATLFWKRTSSSAVFWSLTIGYLSAIVYALFTGDFETSMIIGLIPAFLILITISFFNKKNYL